MDVFFFFFNLTHSRWTSSLPSCLWSQKIFPSLPGSRLTFFLSRCKFSTLTTRQPMVGFYLLTFPRLLCCCCFLTLTDPLRIQPWSQDRRNQTKSNRESEMSMESRQKRDGQEVASKGHRRDKIENINKKHTGSRNKLEPTA